MARLAPLHRAWPLALALVLTACAEPTSILVQVTSERAIPDEIDGLRFTVTGETSGQTVTETYALETDWPHSVSIRPGEVESMDVTILVEGLLGDAVVASRERRESFVSGAEVVVNVRLDEEPPTSDAGAMDAGEEDGGGLDGGVPPGDAGDRDGGPEDPTFSIGGTVTGLEGSGLVLQNAGGDDLVISGNGPFTFATELLDGASYAVTVLTQPSSPEQTCRVSAGSGTVSGADVTSVVVNCAADTYTVGGTLSGLAGGSVVLQNAGGDDLTLSANGTFAFPTPLADGASYDVTVLSQPSSPSQRCTVTNGSGTIGGADVTNVTVTCAPNSFTLGGTVTGLEGTGLVLVNGSEILSVSADGAFTFPDLLENGTSYDVMVLTQPSSPSQTCVVTNGAGTIADANVTDVLVTCTTDTFTIGGTISGLSGTGLVLQNDAGDDLTVTANGSFTFTTPVASGGSYDVTVSTQPSGPSQTCTVSSGAGTVGAANVTSVSVSCTTNTYTVGGTVTGLLGTGLVLRNNGSDDLAISADGSFTFSTPVLSGASFAVTVATQPSAPSQTCRVSAGTGTVGSANVTSVVVNCDANSFTIGGSVSGLSGTVVLQNNAGDDLTLSANGDFAFSAAVTSGASYDVTVLTQPSSPAQTCTVTNGSGTVGSSDVTNVMVTCTTNTYTVGGTVSGLAGSGLALLLNGSLVESVAADGSYTFDNPLSSGATYSVTVFTQPSGPTQTCSVSNGSGTVGSANVTNVNVSCTTNTYTVGGSVSGLSGSGLVLRNGGGDDLTVSANGTFTFATPVASGQPYAVTVATQPSGPAQTCTVSMGSGTVTSANVTSVSVSCTTNTYSIGGTVSGLAGSGLELRNNGGDPLSISADGSFSFPIEVVSGGTYSVTVSSQPSGPTQTCSVTMGSGMVTNADITTVQVTCTTNQYTVGGTVSGLTGSGLVLRNNGGDDLAISGNGSFTFATAIDSGATYAVTVATQPSGPTQTCTVSMGSGTVGGANVTTVAVSCATSAYTIGGTVSGLSGTGLILRNNGGDDLAIPADGSFTFSTPISSGGSYAVTVANQPGSPIQECEVTNGSGTVVDANITDVMITCENTYSIGGTVMGRLGDGLILRNNGGDDLIIGSNGAFTFSTRQKAGTTYAVTVHAQPSDPWQTCTVMSGSGTVGTSDVTSVVVQCTTNTYTVGGMVSGLLGSGLVLRNNGGDDLAISADGSFAFGTPVASGGTYSVTVQTQPTSPWQTCSVTSGSGTVTNANVTSVMVSCTTNQYVIRGNVNRLSGPGLVLRNNGGDDLAITGTGPFAFSVPVDSGAPYAVTIFSQPSSGVPCIVNRGSGTVAGADVTDVSVRCGDKRVFVTSTIYTPDWGGLAGADALCQTHADMAGLGGVYRAWLADDTGSPATRFTTDEEDYELVDGTVVANGWTDLTNGSVDVAISLDENGAAAPVADFTACSSDTIVWTNVASNGTTRAGGAHCTNWTGVSPSGEAAHWGDRTVTTSNWTLWCTGTGSWCNGTRRAPLYCFEQ